MSQARRTARMFGVVATFLMAAGYGTSAAVAAQATLPAVHDTAVTAAGPNLGVPLAVTVNNPGNRVSIEHSSVSLQMTATGGTPPYTWSATGLPAGLSINASTGRISGFLTRFGTYSVTVTATATAGGSGSAQFLWLVKHDACQHCLSGA